MSLRIHGKEQDDQPIFADGAHHIAGVAKPRCQDQTILLFQNRVKRDAKGSEASAGAKQAVPKLYIRVGYMQHICH